MAELKKTGLRITFDDGETLVRYLQPILAAKYIATVTPSSIDPTKFTGEYGIDWCEMDANFSKIVKFQNTPTSDISHILDEPSSQFIKGGTDSQKQALLKKMYKIVQYYGKDYPLTWINLPKGKVASVNIKTPLISGKDEKTDFLTIVKNPNFEIVYDKTTDAGSNPPIKLEKLKSKGSDIEIKALNTFAQTEYIIIQDYNGDEVGKIEMCPNAIENLAVKIIPVVFKSTPATETTDAQALYKNATNGTKLVDSLNKKAFYQAGIHCTIEPIKPSPECIVIDVNTKDWSNYYDASKNTLTDWTFAVTDINKPKQEILEDGIKTALDRTKKFLLDELEQAYDSKYRNNFKGALVFVADRDFIDSSNTTVAYSQNIPLRSQGTIIFKKTISKGLTYVHEISHMLGLEHTFLETDTNSHITKNSKVMNENIKNNNELVASRNKLIKHHEGRIKEYGYDDDGSPDQKFIDKEQLKISNAKKEIEESKKEIKTFKRILSIRKNYPVRITKSKSFNFMDYHNTKVFFNKIQSEIIKKECVDFYK